MHPETVDACAALKAGDRIEAWRGGSLLHRGTVTQTMPGMGLLWIREDSLYERKLLDMAELQIRRIWAGTATHGEEEQLPMQETPATNLPETMLAAEHVTSIWQTRRMLTIAAV